MTENIEEKITSSMSAGDIIKDFIDSDDPKFDGKSKAERTKMALGAYYSMHPSESRKKVKEKIEEGRGRPPKEGSEAWKRRQAAGGESEESLGLHAQLLKHKDQGELGHGEIKFLNNNKAKISSHQREKALRKLEGLRGAGKNPDEAEKTVRSMSKSHEHFLYHIGEGPKPEETRHIMSLAKEQKEVIEKLEAAFLEGTISEEDFTKLCLQAMGEEAEQVDEKLIGKQGVAEGKVKLHTDPSYFGAEVDDTGFNSLPTVNIPTNKLVGFEPDDKMNQPKSKAKVEKIVAGIKKGDKLPPILVRKHKNGHQVLDGHHRLRAYKSLGVKSIPSRIVPDSDIEEIGKQKNIDANHNGKIDKENNMTTPAVKRKENNMTTPVVKRKENNMTTPVVKRVVESLSQQLKKI